MYQISSHSDIEEFVFKQTKFRKVKAVARMTLFPYELVRILFANEMHQPGKVPLTYTADRPPTGGLSLHPNHLSI